MNPKWNQIRIMLNSLLLDQVAFQNRYVEKTLQTRLEDLSKEQLNRLIIQQVLGGICELHEYLEKGTAWKDHRAVETIDHEAALEELVDVMKYVLNIFIYADVSLEEFAEAWNKKTQLVEARFNREFTTTASPSQVEHKTGGAQHGD